MEMRFSDDADSKPFLKIKTYTQSFSLFEKFKGATFEDACSSLAKHKWLDVSSES